MVVVVAVVSVCDEAFDLEDLGFLGYEYLVVIRVCGRDKMG